MNECFEGSTLHNCVNAQCRNTNGSFECDCLPGYAKPLSGGNTCEGDYHHFAIIELIGEHYAHADINECLQTPCDKNATCNNTKGSYTCHCQPPYFNADTDSNECIREA